VPYGDVSAIAASDEAVFVSTATGELARLEAGASGDG
jgi:hypothetical protein